jgi:hypothetical protein
VKIPAGETAAGAEGMIAAERLVNVQFEVTSHIIQVHLCTGVLHQKDPVFSRGRFWLEILDFCNIQPSHIAGAA